jgi:energy-converting hydrogenase Eha subunit A
MSEPNSAPPRRDDQLAPGQRLRAMAGRVAKEKSEIIFSRAWGLFTESTKEWEQIRKEETTLASLFAGYVLPVAAVPTFAGMLGQLIFGERMPEGGVRRPEFITALIGAIVACLAVVALVYLVGLLINLIAEQFDGDRHEMNAFKVAAYSPTPVLVTGLAAIYPGLWWVALFGVAGSAYLMYRGLPILMRSPQDRAAGYATTVMIVALILLLLILMLTGCLTMSDQVGANTPL